MDTAHGRSVVTSKVPLAEILRYVTDLRSMTGGRGIFGMSLSHYQVVPSHVSEEIIAARDREKSGQDGG